MTASVPDGFARHTRRSPLTDPWEPLYACQEDEALVLALRAAEPHTNARGFVHGGLISALADNAMGLSCARRFDPPVSLLTVSLVVDYLAPAQIGAWIEVRTEFVKTGRTLCFASCAVTADGAETARASARFRVAGPRT